MRKLKKQNKTKKNVKRKKIMTDTKTNEILINVQKNVLKI